MMMFYGIRFDLSAICIINILYIALFIIPFRFRANKYYQNILENFFYITNSVSFALICIDFEYFRYTFKRTTADFLDYLTIGGGNDVFALLPNYIVDFWYVVLIWISFIVIMVFLYRKTKKKTVFLYNGIKHYLLSVLMFMFFSGVTILFSRGGFQLRPISVISAGEYTSAQNVPVILNTPFTIINTWDNQRLEKKKYFKSETELAKVFDPVTEMSPVLNFRNNNVVIIILESFSKEHIGSLNKNLDNGKYKGYTPFLDSLIGESLVFVNAFANGKKSIEGIPAIVSGMPTLMNNSYVSSIYAGNNLNSLPSLLKKYGYSSSFYHGGSNGTMKFDDFAKMAGFDNYYGRNEYSNDNDYDGEWGIFDEPFLQYFANNLNTEKQPFISTIFTLSSHHPYRVPQKYKNIFPEGKLDIHKSISYADFALKRFFKTASTMPWFDSTLFVITADHTSHAYFDYYKNNIGQFEVPLILYKHNSNLKGVDSTLTQQIDIMPTVLNYLNYNGRFIAFGNSAFNKQAKHFSISYINNIYQLIMDGFVLQYDGEKTISLHNINNDNMLNENLSEKDPLKRIELEIYIKAIIQSYNNRLIENKLTVR
jgi:phosphoglycerol transferase MdoB-like AlkP superfamily enzyme